MAFIKTHIPCPDQDGCGSSDAASLDDRGKIHCFSCGTTFDGDVPPAVADQKPTPKPHFGAVENLLVTGDYRGCPERGITADTAKLFKALYTPEKAYYGYYGKWDATKIIAVKMRYPDKRFPWVGDTKASTLFGQQLFASGGKYVTITEGEDDALAAYQLLGSKYPVVSIQNGAQGALNSCKAAYEWLDSFEAVVICFDSDEPGQKAAKEVAQLFGGKAKIMKHPSGIKDACEYYQRGRTIEFKDAFWKAERFVPDGIVTMGELRDGMKKPLETSSMLYPWTGLNRMLLGMHPHTIVTWGAGSGVGKSSLLREIVYHTLTHTQYKIGAAFLEEDAMRTGRGIVGLHIGKKIHLPGAMYSPEEVDAAYAALGLEDRVALWRDGAGASIDTTISRLNYYARGLSCDLLVLDHLGMIVNGTGSANERQLIDEIMTRLRSEVAQRNPLTMHVISHLTRPEGTPLENGGKVTLGLLRGSGAIAQLSDVVIGVERDTQADTVEEKNTITLRVLKNRMTGETGIACKLLYIPETGRIVEDTL